MEADLRGDEGENGDGRAFTIWQLVQEHGLLGLSRGQKLPLLRSVEGEKAESAGAGCCGEELLLLWCLLELDRSGRSCYRCGFLQVWPAAVDGGDEVAGYVAAVAWRESGWKKREGMMAPV